MKQAPLKYALIFILAALFLLLSARLEAASESYIYDSMGKRDPFVPLVDTKSPTGLRTAFVPPEEQVKLPLEVGIKGILSRGEEYYAIVNDQVVRAGQNLGAVTIKEIEKDRIVLEYGGREFTVFYKKEKKK